VARTKPFRAVRPLKPFDSVYPIPFDPRTPTFIPSGSVANEHVNDVSSRKLTLFGIKVTRSTTQSIPDSTSPAISYDTVIFREGFAAPAASFTAVRIPYTGIYRITCIVEYAADADGFRNIALEIDSDGTFREGQRLPATATGVWRGSFATDRKLTANQTVGIITTHNAGAATNINAGEDNNALSVIYVGGI
jgi:hypothetical protein